MLNLDCNDDSFRSKSKEHLSEIFKKYHFLPARIEKIIKEMPADISVEDAISILLDENRGVSWSAMDLSLTPEV